jgi:hypothetical protein
MGSEIRLGQLIAPFGPGSIYTDKHGIPTVICGLDYWYKKEDNGTLKEMPDAVRMSLIVEPRLTGMLKVSSLRQPPKYIFDQDNTEISGLKIQGHRFPRWYVNNANGQLRRFNLESIKIEKGAWRPVRFIAVCPSGHMSDFPWKVWAGCACNNEGGLVLNDAGGVDLASIVVRCTQCNNGKSLAGATVINREDQETGLSKVGIPCSGERPWLGDSGVQGNCEKPLAAVLINQSNIYFARTISSIFLPDLAADPVSKKIQEVLNKSSELTSAAVIFKLGDKHNGMNILRKIVAENWDNGSVPADDLILNSFHNLGRGRGSGPVPQTPALPDSDMLAFRRAEFNILRNEVAEGTSSELRIIPSSVPVALQSFFSRVNLVEKLRETRAFYGFDRLERSGNPLDGMPDTAMQQLFLKQPSQELTWLPAVKNYGEGIYLELSELAIRSWLQNKSHWLQNRYDVNFIHRMSNEPLLLPPSTNIDWQWGARYQLVHTLAHILINQLVFECGYSSAALKERLFVSSDAQAPMAGILIYTASGDSDGSLGGLVRMGRPELLESMVKRAISRASWCSADPVCSENLGGVGSRLVNMAACHACILLPETACETINNGLDRAAVIGTPEKRDEGFLSGLLNI